MNNPQDNPYKVTPILTDEQWFFRTPAFGNVAYPDLLNFHYLTQYALEEIDAEMQAAMSVFEERKRRIVEAIHDTMNDSRIPMEERLPLIQAQYYTSRLLSSYDICRIFGTHPNAIASYIGEYEMDAICHECGEDFAHVIKSRTQYNEAMKNMDDETGMLVGYQFRCPDCTAEREREHRERAAEYQRQEAARIKYIQALKSMPYREYLKTEHWQEVRKAALKRAGYRCQTCNAQGELHVHHRTYENRGQESHRDLIVLCAECHQTFHETRTLSRE